MTEIGASRVHWETEPRRSTNGSKDPPKSAEKRQAEAARIREKYPDRIPVIVERAEKSDVPDIDKKNLFSPPLISMDDDDDNDGRIRYMKQFETAKTAVFLDKQACGTPGLNTLQVAQNIRSALEELNYSGPASIFAYCDSEQSWDDDLQSPTIVKHHEPTDEKDRVGRGRIGGFLRRCRRAVSLFADQSENSPAIVVNHIDTEAHRIDLIFADMLIWAMNNPAPANVMLVVGDISRMAFIKSFHRLRSANYNVFLAQPSKASAPRALPIDAKLVWERLSAGEVFIVQIDRSKPLNRSRPLDTGSILLAGAWIVLTYFLKRRSQ